jgi:hypothetical protein
MKHNKRGKVPKAQSSSNKPSREFYLSILNLILTAIIGIGIAIYLNIRNENFQEQLVVLQSKAQLANITVENIKSTLNWFDLYTGFEVKSSEPYGFIIKNNGPATATSLQLAICIGKNAILSTLPLSPSYTREEIPNLEVEDISQFNISTNDIFLQSSGTIASAQYFQSAVDTPQNNLLTLLIPSLPPGSELPVQIEISERLPHKIVVIKRDVQLLIPTPNQESLSDADLISFAEQNMKLYFDHNYSAIADFTVQAKCTNCVVEESLFGNNYNFSFLSVKSWSLSKSPIILSRTDSYLELAFRVSYSLYTPQDYDSIQSSATLYLWQGEKMEEEEYENRIADFSTPDP